MTNPKKFGKWREFGVLLRKLRQRANLTLEGFVLGLEDLIDDAKLDGTDNLAKLGADIDLNEAGNLPYLKNHISDYEYGRSKVNRERVLFFIYFFKQKKVISLDEANLLLRYLEWYPLKNNELAIIFPDEVASSTSPQPVSTALTAKQEESTALVPVAAPLAFEREADGETLIVIAAFHWTVVNTEPHKKIFRAIEAEAKRLGEDNLRVVIERTVLEADQREEAEALGKQYDASMVIWGEDTGVQVLVNFLYLRHPDFPVAVATINETERTFIANLGDYSQFIVDELPKQLTFLSLFAVAHRYYINKNYRRAITLLEEAIASLTDKTRLAGLAEAYYRLGWLYVHKSIANYNRAIEVCNRSIELKPDFAKVYHNRGYIYDNLGMLEEAIAEYSKAIELDPNLALAYNNRGCNYRDQGMIGKAIADYNKAIELDPNDAFSYNNRGIVYHNQEMFKEAIADYNKAIELDPNDAFPYNNRGTVYHEQGMFKEAIAEYSKAIERDPNYAVAYNNRGNTYRAIGMFKEAIADYDTVIQLDSDNAKAHMFRNFAYSEQEMFKGISLKEGFYIEKPEFVKVGVIAFYESPVLENICESAETAQLNTISDALEFAISNGLVDMIDLPNFESPIVEDIREIAIKIAQLDTFPHALEFAISNGFVDTIDLPNGIVEPAQYAPRILEMSDKLLSTIEIALAKKRNATCVFLVIGINPNISEKCFAYFSIKVQRINSLVKMIQEGRITPAIVGRVIHYGLGEPGEEDIDYMFDNWLFTNHKTSVKYVTQ